MNVNQWIDAQLHNLEKLLCDPADALTPPEYHALRGKRLDEECAIQRATNVAAASMKLGVPLSIPAYFQAERP